jgi:hypothetical protein
MATLFSNKSPLSKTVHDGPLHLMSSNNTSSSLNFSGYTTQKESEKIGHTSLTFLLRNLLRLKDITLCTLLEWLYRWTT